VFVVSSPRRTNVRDEEVIIQVVPLRAGQTISAANSDRLIPRASSTNRSGFGWPRDQPSVASFARLRRLSRVPSGLRASCSTPKRYAEEQVLRPDTGIPPLLGEAGRDLERAPGEQVDAERAGPGMPGPPPRAASYPSLRGLQRMRTEAGRKAPLYLLHIDAETAQRTSRIDSRTERRTDAQQLGTRGGQIQALRPQHGGRRAGAVPQQPEQHVLVPQAGVAQLTGLHEGEP